MREQSDFEKEGGSHEDPIEVLRCKPCWVGEAFVQYAPSAAPGQEAGLYWESPLHDRLCCLDAAPYERLLMCRIGVEDVSCEHKTRWSADTYI